MDIASRMHFSTRTQHRQTCLFSEIQVSVFPGMACSVMKAILVDRQGGEVYDKTKDRLCRLW